MSSASSEETLSDTTDATFGTTQSDLYDTTEMSDAPENDVASLRAEIDEANRRADSEHEAFLRARADFANFKRRTEEERESLRQFIATDLLTKLLPVVDNFERASDAAAQTNDYEKLVGGVNAVYRQLQEFLTKEGVTPIDALYQPFDPNIHNAVLREETTEYPENTVTQELQRGYLLNGKVLRATMVKVSAGDE